MRAGEGGVWALARGDPQKEAGGAKHTAAALPRLPAPPLLPAQSWTTDGPGGWGAGVVGHIENGTTIVVPRGLSTNLAAAGATAVVVSGPGAGQYRAVRSRPNATAVTVAAPFDAHVVPGASVVAVVATVGAKIVAGNNWTWGSVVQAFGTTLTGVFADNRLAFSNNAGADSGPSSVDGSITAFGLCYGGEPQPVFFLEVTGNALTSSNGVSLHDRAPEAACNASWAGGPYVRWAAVRGNAIGGVAPSSPGVCGAINASNPGSTDLLVEANTFDCPPGALLPGGGVNVAASHSVVR